MAEIAAGVVALGLVGMAIGLAMLYLQGKALEGMLGDIVRAICAAESQMGKIEDKLNYLIVRRKPGPKAKEG